MRFGERHELRLAVGGEAQAHDPMILLVGHPLDEAGPRGAIDELDGTVVTQHQVLGHVADGRRPAVSADGQQELVLSTRESDGSGLVVAPSQEAPQPGAEAQQALEVGIGKATRWSIHIVPR